MKFTIFFFPALLFIVSCNGSKGSVRNVESFYFPLNQLSEGKIYEYHSTGNESDPPIYWHYKSEKIGESEYLTGTSYGPAMTPDQYVKEEKVANGMLLQDFITFEKDENGKAQPVKANVVNPNVFSFGVKKHGSVVVTTIKWTALDGSAHYTFVRNRQFETDTTVNFNGKNIQAVKFNIIELIDQEEQGHLELEYGGTEIYARGIGLFAFSKDISEGWQMQYQLVNIYTKEEFEKKFNARLEESWGH